MRRAPRLLIQSELEKCRRRDYVQGFKLVVLLVGLLCLNIIQQVNSLKIQLSLLLFLQVVISGSIFATIGCTKMFGFFFSILSFLEIFILAVLQTDFCLSIATCEDIKVSLAIVLTFLIGIICYLVSIACFCC